jgi:hypothetical protein
MFTGDAILYYIGGASRSFEANPMLASDWVRDAMRMGFAVITLVEACSWGILVWRRFRLMWLIVIACFHLLTVIFMNISFWENVVLATVVLVPRWWKD